MDRALTECGWARDHFGKGGLLDETGLLPKAIGLGCGREGRPTGPDRASTESGRARDKFGKGGLSDRTGP